MKIGQILKGKRIECKQTIIVELKNIASFITGVQVQMNQTVIDVLHNKFQGEQTFNFDLYFVHFECSDFFFGIITPNVT